MSSLLFSRRAFLLSSILSVALAASGSRALGQGHTPDPYNIVGEYNSQYEPYIYAAEPSQEGTVPNQQKFTARLPGARASSESINGLDDLEGNTLEPTEPSSSRRRAGAGTQYYRATLDDDRPTRTNRDTDESYYANQRKRSEEYFKAMSVKDPKKRARLLRELNLENLRVSRMLPNFRTSAAGKRGERLNFDTATESLDDPDSTGRPRDGAGDDELPPRKRPTTDSDETSPLKSRSGVGSRSRRPGPTLPPRARRGASSPTDATSAVDSILERSDRLESSRASSSAKPSTNSTRRPSSSKP